MPRRGSAAAPEPKTIAGGSLPARRGAEHEPPVWSAECGPDETIRLAYAEIAKSCRCAGVGLADAEDLAQDIWTWILRAEVPLAVIATPWLRAVVHNYILRFRRRSYKRRVREGQPLETVPEPASWQSDAPFESKQLLDRVAPLLRKRERSLLMLIRRGYSFAQASRRLGIPPGSWAYHQGHLIACARRALKRSTATPIKPGSLDHV